jgi:carbon-monoxide dehydrogenase large subunit
MDGSAGKAPWIGRAMPRREDARLLAGRGRFVADLAPPGCLRLEVLRSSYGAGRLLALDTDAAQAMPGVRLVLTGDDLQGAGAAAVNPLLPDARAVPMQPLAQGMVRAAGQAVAAVVAGTAAQARDAAEAIDHTVDPGAPDLAPVAAADWQAGAGPEGAVAVTVRIEHAQVAPFALEPRAALAWVEDGRLTVHLSTQTPQRCRDDLATILGLPRDRVRVIAPDVGGAFGGKASLMPEDVLVALAAWRLRAPVLWVASRSDEFLAATRGRGSAASARLTLERDGRLRTLSARFDFPLGHWMPYSALAPARNAGRILPGPYAVPAVTVGVAAHLSEGPAVNIYRGAGRPEAAILMERLIDKAARATGLDPLDLRRRALAALPARTAAGEAICSGDFAGLLDALEAAAGIGARRAALAARRADGAVCGLGVALYAEPCGQGWETAECRLDPDGGITAATGSSAQGQGRETAFAQIVADRLGCAPDRVRVVAGDTDAVPEGIGALASRSTAIGGTAMALAADDLAERLRAAAGRLLNAPAAAVTLTPDGARAGAARLGWPDLARRAAADGADLSARLRYDAPAEAWASGAVAAEVAVDPETGTVTVERIVWVDDAGRVVNPLLVEGQMIGGLAQGLGATLMERIVQADGQLLTGSLMDYAVPRATDMPPLRLVSRPVASPANGLGAKGVGEAGCIGVPAAILNAVMDALPDGAPDLSLPLTPEKVWRALNGMEP